MHHIFILFFLPFTSNPTLHLRWWCRSLRVGHLSQSYWRKSENWQKIRINSYIADFQTTLLLWMYRLCFAIVNNYFSLKPFQRCFCCFKLCFQISIMLWFLLLHKHITKIYITSKIMCFMDIHWSLTLLFKCHSLVTVKYFTFESLIINMPF